MRGLRAAASTAEKQQLASIEDHCCRELVKVINLGALRSVKEGKKNKHLRVVSEASSNFCEIALYYQNAFDVLSNGGDYTSVVWGALKLLMIYRVNDKTLQSEVKKHLHVIGGLLTEISTFSYLPNTRQMQQTITKIYELLLEFLYEAVRYYKENKLS